MLFQDLFFPQVSLLEKAIRAIVVYFALVILLRIAGKRELAQLNSFDLVVLLLLSNTVQNAIVGNDNSMVGGIFGALVLLALNSIVAKFLYTHKTLEHELRGEPVVLIDKGVVLEANLARETIPVDELLVAVHQQGIEKIEDVERAILETSGAISVFAKHPIPPTETEVDVEKRLDKIEETLTGILEKLGGGRPGAADPEDRR